MGNFAKRNWSRLLENPGHSEQLWFRTEMISVDIGKPVRLAMIGLNKLIDARSRVVEDPNIRGGIPTIRGTRIGVYQIAGLRKNEDMEVVSPRVMAFLPDRPQPGRRKRRRCCSPPP